LTIKNIVNDPDNKSYANAVGERYEKNKIRRILIYRSPPDHASCCTKQGKSSDKTTIYAKNQQKLLKEMAGMSLRVSEKQAKKEHKHTFFLAFPNPT
jgi:hypothetical protein